MDWKKGKPSFLFYNSSTVHVFSILFNHSSFQTPDVVPGCAGFLEGNISAKNGDTPRTRRGTKSTKVRFQEPPTLEPDKESWQPGLEGMHICIAFNQSPRWEPVNGGQSGAHQHQTGKRQSATEQHRTTKGTCLFVCFLPVKDGDKRCCNSISLNPH